MGRWVEIWHRTSHTKHSKRGPQRYAAPPEAKGCRAARIRRGKNGYLQSEMEAEKTLNSSQEALDKDSIIVAVAIRFPFETRRGKLPLSDYLFLPMEAEGKSNDLGIDAGRNRSFVG